jgi:uncharacterized protein YprB with RNaseH-like and TPR domain
MLDESLRRRLESLNRGPLPVTGAIPNPRAAVKELASPGLNSVSIESGSASQHRFGLLRSGEEVETNVGPHLRIRLPVETLWSNGARFIFARQEFLRSQAATSQAIEPSMATAPEFAPFVAALPDRAVALDLETCGLAGSALFLVGLLRPIDGQPSIELLLARNYAEEAAVLASFWQTIADYEVLLTFNGKSFDWPMVVERSIRHRLKVGARREQFGHIDVLHHARRRWRKELPNCRLQTLEWHVCRRRRTGDIPGHCIPAVYADYVRTGFARDMDTVLHHNALDLVTLFDLALRLAA